MEIECPDYAVAIWLEGDQVQIRFPDRQQVYVHLDDLGGLKTIIRHRASMHAKGQRLGLGTDAAPIQYVLDKRAQRTRDEIDAFAIRRKAATQEQDDILAAAGL